MPYRPNEIEARWQHHWDAHGSYVAREDFTLPKFYALDMFPYPSGKGLHVGHPASYTPGDVVCRYKRALGFNVLHPMGYDAFGLPAEQRAIDEGVAPQVSTEEAITNFRRQLKMLGLSYDWSRELSTASPDYYKWTQWIFTRLLAAERVYLGASTVNWCEALSTVLANDEVVDGRSERGGHPVVQKQMRQWMIRITAYADQLLEGLETIDWPEATKTMQRERIGRSQGAEVRFAVTGDDATITVFTTRPDTLWGATYLVLAPEHELVARITTDAQRAAVEAYVRRSASRSELERRASKEKTGVWTGAFATNPATCEQIPVWIADYVLHGYGTGAIMAVPAHDERDWAFARAMSLPVREVVSGGNVAEAAYAGEGTMVNSGPLDGVSTRGGEAVSRAVAWLEARSLGRGTVTYSLRDWAFARQRYWGEPIPVLKDEHGELVRALRDDELPLVLPAVADYRPRGTGESPLANAEDWVRVTDPETGRALRRETDTMPGSAGSSWYFLRYCDPKNADALCDRAKSDYWMPVDLYVGGDEHAVGHLLYARMWQRFLHDIGAVRDAEPFAKLRHQGMVLGETFFAPSETEKFPEAGRLIPEQVFHRAEDAGRVLVKVLDRAEDTARVLLEDGREAVVNRRFEKMSKRYGNVVNPDEVIRDYGADALRVYLCFLGPLESDKPWQTSGLESQHNWLKRVWRIFFEGDDDLPRVTDDAADEADLRTVHKAIKKVTRDIETLNLNTAISALHVATRDLLASGARARAVLEPLAQIINPFAPHLAEELWTRALGHPVAPGGVSYAPWPVAEERYATDALITIGVQVNGKTVGTVDLPRDADEDLAVRTAQATPGVARACDGKAVTKVIYKAGKILNLIVR